MELLTRVARDEASRARAAGQELRRPHSRPSSPARAASSTCSTCRRATAAAASASTPPKSSRCGPSSTRLNDAHRRTLDQLATGVAIFAADQRLSFYNAAYRSLWDLDTGFLDQTPTNSAVLDQLRSGRKLPEENDFRAWKAALHEAYRATEAARDLWHLPDGRTIRVVTTPDPQGGVIYLFEDVTERLDMARRYDALIRVQGETLDNLAEAVAVFGSDGRLRLHNPAFADMWRLDAAALAERPHIEALIDWCKALYDDDALWRAIHGAVTAIESREWSRAGSSSATEASRTVHTSTTRRRNAGRLPGCHRHRQHRAGAARAERGVGRC